MNNHKILGVYVSIIVFFVLLIASSIELDAGVKDTTAHQIWAEESAQITKAVHGKKDGCGDISRDKIYDFMRQYELAAKKAANYSSTAIMSSDESLEVRYLTPEDFRGLKMNPRDYIEFSSNVIITNQDELILILDGAMFSMDASEFTRGIEAIYSQYL